ncbi:MAG TPA: hypothetical protein VHX90_02225 [Verrucomicrobiae bacterium]|nr:hypothetical protein [Verrucomicrobiae bacterium]
MRPGFWRKCRVCFRWFRITTLLVVLAAVCAFAWLNRVGLPDFLKTRLVAALHSRGFELEFSRMRLRVVRGFVAENVRIGAVRNSDSPTLSLAEVQLRLNFRALLHRQFQIDGLVLREGELVWPISPTNNLVLEQIQTDLRFQTNDTWSLDNFRANFAGAQLDLSGEIAHAPEIRNWEIFQGRKSTNRPVQLQKIFDTLARIHFDGSPQLSLDVNGDARAIHSIIVQLAIAQSQTRLELDGGADDAAENYHWRAHGALDPEFARPFLAAFNATDGLDILKFTHPIFLDAIGRGRLDNLDSIGATGRVALTNFMVRGETFGDVQSELNYTNRVLEFLKPLMHTGLRRDEALAQHSAGGYGPAKAGAQMMTADSVTLDFNTRLLYFTNGFSIADPEPIARAIGPKVGRIVEPYHFLQPPTARVNGQIPLRDMNNGRDMADVDMRFDIIKGAPFEWMKLKTPDITGTIHWRAQTLAVTNVAAAFYGGSGNGFAYFDFHVPHEGADYNFAFNVADVDLHLLAAELSSPTNSLEGALSGQLVVTRADTRDWHSWDGFGQASLHDGLIWEIPIFGIISTALNTVWPGLGNSRATAATAKFAVTNGVIFTDSLEIRSTLTRLQYVGTVDMDQKVNARVTAQLLRDTWAVGPLISTLLTPVGKLFESKITGTLKNPKSEPILLPARLLLMPLHPIRSLEEIFPGGASMNSPPGN